MDKLPKMDCKGRKFIFYCKSFLENMFMVFGEVCGDTNLGLIGIGSINERACFFRLNNILLGSRGISLCRARFYSL